MIIIGRTDMTTLKDFLSSVPPELRVGQHFFNTYFSKLSANTSLHASMNDLYFTKDSSLAFSMIVKIMEAYQWQELPNV